MSASSSHPSGLKRSRSASSDSSKRVRPLSPSVPPASPPELIEMKSAPDNQQPIKSGKQIKAAVSRSSASIVPPPSADVDPASDPDAEDSEDEDRVAAVASATAARGRRRRSAPIPGPRRDYYPASITTERLKYMYRAINFLTDIYFAVDKDLDHLPQKRGNREKTKAELDYERENPWLERAMELNEGAAKDGPVEIPDTVSVGYGELSRTGFDKILHSFQFEVPEERRINASSTFLDIGSGFGKCVLHAKLRINCASSVGIEYIYTRHQRAQECLFHLSAQFVPGLTDAPGGDLFTDEIKSLDLSGCSLIQGDITDDKFHDLIMDSTHIYAFDVVFSDKTHERMLPRIAQSTKLQLYACYTNPIRMKGYGVDEFFHCVHRTKARTTGGQWFSCYFYIPVLVPSRFSSRSAAVAYLNQRIEMFKSVDAIVEVKKAQRAVKEKEMKQKAETLLYDGFFRKPKAKREEKESENQAEKDQEKEKMQIATKKRGRGRPRKEPAQDSGAGSETESDQERKRQKATKKARKDASQDEDQEEDEDEDRPIRSHSNSFAAYLRSIPVEISAAELETIEAKALRMVSSTRAKEDAYAIALEACKQKFLVKKRAEIAKEAKIQFEQLRQKEEKMSKAKAAAKNKEKQKGKNKKQKITAPKQTDAAKRAGEKNSAGKSKSAVSSEPDRSQPSKKHSEPGLSMDEAMIRAVDQYEEERKRGSGPAMKESVCVWLMRDPIVKKLKTQQRIAAKLQYINKLRKLRDSSNDEEEEPNEQAQSPEEAAAEAVPTSVEAAGELQTESESAEKSSQSADPTSDRDAAKEKSAQAQKKNGKKKPKGKAKTDEPIDF